MLDTLARKSLWDVGLDYGHGTGHGVGHFLNVHEGPMAIHYRFFADDPGLEKNMFVSNGKFRCTIHWHVNNIKIFVYNRTRLLRRWRIWNSH